MQFSYVIIIPMILIHSVNNTFNGIIHKQHLRPDNIETREAYSFLNTDVPFDDIVKSYEEITICGDTLISIHSDQIGLPYSTYIQLKDRLYIQLKDGSYKRIRQQLGIGEIDKLYTSQKRSNQLGMETAEYKATSKNGDTDYILQVTPMLNFKHQAKNKYLFANVFSEEGIILYINKKYLPSNMDFISIVDQIEFKKLTCKEKIEELNFIEPD